MLNHYETVFILTPILSDDHQVKEAVEKYKAFLIEKGAIITHQENWGLRKLQYPIQKQTSGFYTLLQFDAEPTLIASLETQFKRDEQILRFLSIRLDKYAYEYAEKRKKLQSKTVKED